MSELNLSWRPGQIFVHGSSLKSRTVAVVVPDEPSIKFWAEGKGIPSHSLSALCNNKELKVRRLINGRLSD